MGGPVFGIISTASTAQWTAEGTDASVHGDGAHGTTQL